jgi:hypothetical protein
MSGFFFWARFGLRAWGDQMQRRREALPCSKSHRTMTKEAQTLHPQNLLRLDGALKCFGPASKRL